MTSPNRYGISRRRFLSFVMAGLAVASCQSGELDVAGLYESAGLQTPELVGVYFISPDGIDTNTGRSPQAPWATFAYAMEQMADGDTLRVMDGTYRQLIVIDKRITIERHNGAPTIVASSDDEDLCTILAPRANLTGLTFERHVNTNSRTALIRILADGTVVENCTCRGNITESTQAFNRYDQDKSAGIIIRADQVLVQACECSGTCFGIIVTEESGRNSVIRDCMLHHTIQSCLLINFDYQVRGLLVDSCSLSYSYIEDGIQWQQDFSAGLEAISNRGTFVRNCVMIGNAENGVDLKGADGHTIENCRMTRIVGNNDGMANNEVNNIAGPIGRGANARSRNVRIRNCVVWNSHNGMAQKGPSYYYYNNTLVANNYSQSADGSLTSGQYPGFGYALTNDFFGCGFRNNLVAGHMGPQAAIGNMTDLDIDYNLYVTNGGSFAIENKTYAWQDWLLALQEIGVSGADQNSKHFSTWSTIALEDCPEFPTAQRDYNFLPKISSPAYQAGGPLTICVASGMGKEVPVQNAGWFCDGYGIVEGDSITVGNTTTRIADIAENLLILEDSVRFRQDMGVYWGRTSLPNIGIT